MCSTTLAGIRLTMTAVCSCHLCDCRLPYRAGDARHHARNGGGWRWYVDTDIRPNSSQSAHLTCADIIELGMPFTDPIADGPTIQTANTVR
jgi:hypothetical protein